MRVLVVDDDPVACRALATVLEGMGYRCELASGGREALAKHRARPFEIVVSDWSMPEGDGVELCGAIRALGGRYVYFVLVTAHGDKEHMVTGMTAGADAFVAKPVDGDELGARMLPAKRIIELQNELIAESRAARKDSQRFYVVSRVDALTGLRNRRALEEDLPAVLDEAKRYERACSCAMLDIDQFKLCNDAFGHLAGDDVLRRVADGLRAELRKSDVVYRYGGEEFLVLLPEQSATAAGGAMERVLRAIERIAIRHAPSAERAVITLSAGVAQLEIEKGDAALDWIARADAALYRAKRAGRNRVVVDAEGWS